MTEAELSYKVEDYFWGVKKGDLQLLKSWIREEQFSDLQLEDVWNFLINNFDRHMPSHKNIKLEWNKTGYDFSGKNDSIVKATERVERITKNWSKQIVIKEFYRIREKLKKEILHMEELDFINIWDDKVKMWMESDEIESKIKFDDLKPFYKKTPNVEAEVAAELNFEKNKLI